jgi:hypothetical protein
MRLFALVSTLLVGVDAGSVIVGAVNVGRLIKAPLVSIKDSTAAATLSPAKSSSITTASSIALVATSMVAATSTLANPTGLPTTFSAPVQGQGTLSLKNLPAMPVIIDKTFSSVLGSVYGLSKSLVAPRCLLDLANELFALQCRACVTKIRSARLL